MIDLPSAITDFRSRGATSFHAKADNVAFEERLSADRLADYAAHAAVNPGWEEHHRAYVAARVNRTGRQTPDTFLDINAAAHRREGFDDNQAIVRLEEIDWVLTAKGVARHEFLGWVEVVKSVVKSTPYQRDEAQGALEEFVEFWNAKRDNRPIFAGFEGDVEADVSVADWPNRLRDRWGLGHYDPPVGGQPITVLLMRYDVKEVRRAVEKRRIGTAFADPTALDGPLNECFFPAPAELRFGRTLDLQPDGNCERHVAEILHQRIDYKLSHLSKLGVISAPRPRHSMRERRNDHLACLRFHSDRDDFGQDIPAHVVD